MSTDRYFILAALVGAARTAVAEALGNPVRPFTLEHERMYEAALSDAQAALRKALRIVAADETCDAATDATKRLVEEQALDA